MARVHGRIEELFALSPGKNGGASRPAFSRAEARAMLLVAAWAREAGLEPSVDPHGNLWCLPPGDAPCVTSGSHVDTVPGGGRYDGPLGTVLAVEAASRAGGGRGVLVCAAEEASRFGAGTIGSRSMTGKLSEGDLSRLRDTGGLDALTARAEYLDALGGLPRLRSAPLERVSSHVEVHIEQRAALRDKGLSLGVATTIAGPVRHGLRFSGEVAHAGETPASERRDALCAAAETVLLAEELGRRCAPETTATVGTLEIHPNSLTSIPGTAKLGVDIRGVRPGGARRLLEELLDGARKAADRRGVYLEEGQISASEPTEMDGAMVAAVEEACARLGVRCGRCVSFAGHDAQHLAAVVPSALLFVASENGVSHAPGEAVAEEDVEAALGVLCLLMESPRGEPSVMLRGLR
ncbi:Zn-dependent hydrolase [Rubrobacter tropicus]|uniref:Zn-dependent hydrolase n=1 Tax=Rubrobacter tropicus TaxID=2653851 RepID=UPI00140D731B|nr:Zn-dependent hydrolase [Rubrobacter tropicus]